MTCEIVLATMTTLVHCVETDEGSRITTHCLYPSFQPVEVFVVAYGEGFKVHDGGGAMRCIWDHGRDLALGHRMLSRQAAAHHLQIVEHALVADVPNQEWLPSAILAVANASATAAHTAVERVIISQEAALKDKIYAVLVRTVPEKSITRSFEMVGHSGKHHAFDYGVQQKGIQGPWLLLNAVAPHHVSIAAKYVAFSDTEKSERVVGKFAVHDRPLETDDVSLLSQVADLVPFASLEAGVKRELAR